MDEFQSEKEQIEEIKQWWKEHRSFIVTGVVLGAGFLGGLKYYVDFKEKRASAASAHYEELTKAIVQKDRNGATDLLGKLTGDFGATPYSGQAALAMAKLYVESGEPELAAEQLRSVLDKSKDNYLKMVARLRLARVQLSQDRPDDALSTLAVTDAGKFAVRFHEVRGDAYAALDRNDDARLEYLSALAGFEPGLIDQQMVEMKLNNLARGDSANMGSDATPSPATDNPSGLPTDTAADTEPDA